MAETNQEEIVLTSRDQKFRWRIYINWNGGLGVQHFVKDEKDGSWKPKGQKVIASADERGVA